MRTQRAVAVPLMPDGSLETDAVTMLGELGSWTTVNGIGIYGSRAWKRWGEGKRVLPRGALNRRVAHFKFTTEDFRFTLGKDGALYVWCMTVPPSQATLKVRLLGQYAGLLDSTPKRVELLGSDAEIDWSQDAESLAITCPDMQDFRHAVGFRIEL